MAKGSQLAKKAGEFKGSKGFESRPPGLNYFSLKDGQVADVRFLSAWDDIEWARKWKTPPSSNFPYGELINCVDQFEDGTPDPGYAAGLKSSFKGYPLMIWRNQPQFARDNNGKLIKDGMGNKQQVGFADAVAVWECSYTIYEMLGEKEQAYRSLTAFDWKIRRVGSDKNTKYVIEPSEPFKISEPQPLTPADQQLIASSSIDVAAVFCRPPSFEELQNYLNGGASPAAPPSFAQQAAQNSTGVDGQSPFGATSAPDLSSNPFT